MRRQPYHDTRRSNANYHCTQLAAAASMLSAEGASDIRSPEGRAPNLRRNPLLVEPSLTARAAALEAARRRPRMEVGYLGLISCCECAPGLVYPPACATFPHSQGVQPHSCLGGPSWR